MHEVPPGETGKMWFKTATPFEYFHDADKTPEARSADGTMSTVGDIGYLDNDGYLHLTDRRTFMIISGGVNIYPQECENLLDHPPEGRGRRGVRRAQRGPRRRGQGGGAADAGRRAGPGARGRADRLLPREPRPS